VLDKVSRAGVALNQNGPRDIRRGVAAQPVTRVGDNGVGRSVRAVEALPVVDVEGGVLLRSSRHGHLGQIEREGIQGMQFGDVSHQAVTDCLPGGRVESAEIVGARHALGGDETSSSSMP